MKPKKNTSEQEMILSSLRDIQTQLLYAEAGFKIATDEALIDSFIYEIQSLHKQYEYWFKRAKALNLIVNGNVRIS